MFRRFCARSLGFAGRCLWHPESWCVLEPFFVCRWARACNEHARSRIHFPHCIVQSRSNVFAYQRRAVIAIQGLFRELGICFIECQFAWLHSEQHLAGCSLGAPFILVACPIWCSLRVGHRNLREFGLVRAGFVFVSFDFRLPFVLRLCWTGCISVTVDSQMPWKMRKELFANRWMRCAPRSVDCSAARLRERRHGRFRFRCSM